jgi:uncharacterized protein (TIGR02118 family)
MIKIVFCLHRLPHLTRAEFQNYWRNIHAPLVAHRSGILRIRKYVQNHTPDDSTFASLAASRGGLQSYDGIAELWIDDTPEGAGTYSAADRSRAALDLLEDEKKFIDLLRSPIFCVREHDILQPDS